MRGITASLALLFIVAASAEQSFPGAEDVDSQQDEWTHRFLQNWRGTILLFVCSLFLYGLSSCCKQTFANGGVPPAGSLDGSPESFSDPSLMAKLATDRMALQARCDFRFWPLFMNQPWLKGARPDYWWGGGVDGLPTNIEWMGNQPFPNGETRTHSAWHMTVSFWSFMFNWKKGGARWCLFVMALRGFVLPMSAQITAWALDEIDTHDARSDQGILRHVAGTPSQILLYYAFMLLGLYTFDTALEWSYELEVPEGGPRRELKVRLQRKFMSLKSDTAKAWPGSRCTALIEQDAPTVIQTWTKIFSLAKDVSSIVGTVLIAIVNNTDISGALGYLPIFGFVTLFAVLDFRQRVAQLKDMAQRKRAWIAAESSMSTRGIRNCREYLHYDSGEFDFDFFAASFVAWYRIAHCWFVQLATNRACNLTNNLALAIVVYVCGDRVLQKEMTMSQCTAVILLLGIFSKMITSIISSCTTLTINYASLVAVSEVLNVNEGFDEFYYAEGSEDSDASVDHELKPLEF
jgi:ABC-type multidrug transport system fused ATPase/permease subunit